MADDQKSTFTISDSEIMFKLHEAALKKAIEKVSSFGDKNYAIVNTGVGKRTKSKGVFENKDGLYEVGIALRLEKYEDPADEDLQSKSGDAEKKKQEDIEKSNKKLVKDAQNACMAALNQYFIWFAGEETLKKAGGISTKTAKAFNLEDQTDVKKLVKNYDDKGFMIPSLDEKKLEEVRAKNKGLKPIIGYKAGFQFIYERKD